MFPYSVRWPYVFNGSGGRSASGTVGMFLIAIMAHAHLPILRLHVRHPICRSQMTDRSRLKCGHCFGFFVNGHMIGFSFAVAVAEIGRAPSWSAPCFIVRCVLRLLLDVQRDRARVSGFPVNQQ